MTKIYAEYPNAARMEVQLLEQLLGTKVVRNEIATGKGRKRVVYEIATLGVQEEGARRERSPMPAPEVIDGEQGRLF